MKWDILRIVLVAIFAVSLMACEREGPAERAGERIDEAVEKAGDELEKASDKIEDKTQN